MRTLLTAPDNPDLKSIAATVAAISRFHQTTSLIGTVRELDIQSAVQKGPYAVIWFCTHGGTAGISLSGSILSPEAIGQYTEQSGAKLCVMSTCDSEDIANRIIAGGNADMVCTITAQVDDTDAARFDALFAKELADLPEPEDDDLPDFELAFDKAKGRGSSNYRYIRAKAALRGLAAAASDRLDKLYDAVALITQKQYEHGVDIHTLSDRIAANSDRLTLMAQQALAAQQQSTQAQVAAGQMATMERNLTTSQQPTRQFTPTFWLLLMLVAFVSIAVLLLARGLYF